MEWMKSVKGVILDMCGVLYDSGEGGGKPIPGSVEAVERSAPKLLSLVINTAALTFLIHTL